MTHVAVVRRPRGKGLRSRRAKQRKQHLTNAYMTHAAQRRAERRAARLERNYR